MGDSVLVADESNTDKGWSFMVQPPDDAGFNVPSRLLVGSAEREGQQQVNSAGCDHVAQAEGRVAAS